MPRPSTEQPERHPRPPRRMLAVFACALVFAAKGGLPEPAFNLNSTTVRISVLSLFHPRQLLIRSAPGNALEITAGSEHFSISKGTIARARLDGTQLVVSTDQETHTIRCATLTTHPASSWTLQISGKLRRRYSGSLTITPRGPSLEAVITMPLETAVASIIAAESPPDAPIEALKAQAVATRSFLVARQSGHTGFDFCDTTHCQFLRSPPPDRSLAAQAAAATQGLTLTWHDAATAEDQPVAAMYTRSCAGETRSLREIGAQPAGYPYYAVRCAYCRRHPEAWQRQLSPGGVPRTERDRLLYNRIHGWGAIPSLSATPSSSPGTALLTGRGIGHGIGLCQLGAADMARTGASFDRILAHYYPNTRIASLPR